MKPTITVSLYKGRFCLRSKLPFPQAFQDALRDLGYDLKNPRRVTLANRIDHISDLEGVSNLTWQWGRQALSLFTGLDVANGVATSYELHMPEDPGPWWWQSYGRGWLVQNKRAILSHAVGTGKTKTAIMAAESVLDEFFKILVICPKPIIPSWKSEIQRWAQDPDRFRVINYESAHRASGKFGVLILDELHRLRNHRSKRRGLIADFAGKCPYVFGLSASPIQNHFHDIYSTLNLLAPRSFPSYWQFVREFYRVYPTEWSTHTIGGFRDEKRDRADLLLRRYCQSLSRDQLIGNEEINYDIRRFSLLRDHRSAYDGIDKGESEAFDATNIHDILAKVTRLRQAAISPSLIDPSWPLGDTIPLAAHIIQENLKNGPFVVFSELNGALHGLADYMFESNDEYCWYTGENPKEREYNREQFVAQEAPWSKIIFANIKAGGEGLSFHTEGVQCLFLSLWYNPETIRQAIGRLTRDKPTDVNVFVLCPEDTISERIIQIILEKDSEVRMSKDSLKELMG